MKTKLQAGEAAFGCSVMIPSPQIVEMVAHAGFDWVLIDMEHGTIGLESCELMTMAADAAGITPIVRPTSNRAEDITQAMDRGAMGVQVPHVNTAEDARRAVSAVRFGPGAGRGLAVGTRPDRYGMGAKMSDFTQQANEQSLVCVQFEHRAAIDNADEILAVDGVDVFFIGPSDLSQSMGHPGNAAHPDVAGAIDATLAKITAAGHCSGMPAAADAVEATLAKGVTYTYTHLPKLLGAGVAAFMARAGR